MPLSADQEDVLRHLLGESLRGGQIDGEALEVAIVDADDAGVRVQGALQLGQVVDLHENLQLVGVRGVQEVDECWPGPRAATMSRMASAPATTASKICASWMMKSFRSTGDVHLLANQFVR
jgi:hypothetical protein